MPKCIKTGGKLWHTKKARIFEEKDGVAVIVMCLMCVVGKKKYPTV